MPTFRLRENATMSLTIVKVGGNAAQKHGQWWILTSRQLSLVGIGMILICGLSSYITKVKRPEYRTKHSLFLHMKSALSTY